MSEFVVCLVASYLTDRYTSRADAHSAARIRGTMAETAERKGAKLLLKEENQ